MEAALMKRLATLVMITASFGLLSAIGPCALKADDAGFSARVVAAMPRRRKYRWLRTASSPA
jgi:hypothetical protein